METERQFVEGQPSAEQAPMIGDRQIVNSMLASNAVDKRVMDDRAVGPYELDIDPATIANNEVLTFSVVNNVITLTAMPASSIGGIIPANASVDVSKINTGTDTPVAGEFLQYTAAGLRWSAIPRQTNITADEIASGVIPTIPSTLPPTDGSVSTSSLASDFKLPASNIADGVIPTIPTSLPPTAGSVVVASLASGFKLPASNIADGVIPTVPTNLPPTASSVLPSMINAGGTAEAGKILKLTSATAWGWADDNSGSGGGSTPANESVTEAKLDAHNDPTNGYALKWSSTNGLYWGEDENTTYTIPTQLPPTDGSVSYAKLSITDATSGQVLTYDGTGLAWTDKSDTTIPDDSIAEVKLDIHNAPSDGKYLKYDSTNGMEWDDTPAPAADSITVVMLKTTDAATEGNFLKSTGSDSTMTWSDISADDLPTISYNSLSDKPTIPTVPSTLPPTDDSVGEAAINATDTPSDGEFLQVSFDAEGVRTLNWSAALTGAAESITETMLDIHNSPSTGKYLRYTSNGMEWDDAVSTIADDSIGEVKLDIHNAPSTGKFLGYTSNGMEWVDDNDSTPTLQSLVNGTPSATNNAIVWDNTNSRYAVGAFPTPTLQSLVHGSPTAALPYISWDNDNSRFEFVAAPSGGGGGSNTDWEIAGTRTYSSQHIQVSVNFSSGKSLDDYDLLYFDAAGAGESAAVPARAGTYVLSPSVSFTLTSTGISANFGAFYSSGTYRIYGRKLGGGGFNIGGTQTSNKIVAATSATEQEWKDLKDLIHGTPTDDQVVAWDNDNSRLYFKDDEGSTPTLQSLVNGTPSSNQVVAWDSTNSRAYWKNDSNSVFTVGGTKANDKIVAAVSTGQEWKDLKDLIHGTPTDDQVVAWDNTNSRLYFKDDAEGGGGLTIGGTQASNKVIAATSASAQSWTELKDLVHGTPTDDQVVAWDNTNSRLYFKDDATSSSSYSTTLLFSSSSGVVAQASAFNLSSGSQFSNYDEISFWWGVGNHRVLSSKHDMGLFSSLSSYTSGTNYRGISDDLGANALSLVRASDTSFYMVSTGSTVRLYRIYGHSR